MLLKLRYFIKVECKFGEYKQHFNESSTNMVLYVHVCAYLIEIIFENKLVCMCYQSLFIKIILILLLTINKYNILI